MLPVESGSFLSEVTHGSFQEYTSLTWPWPAALALGLWALHCPHPLRPSRLKSHHSPEMESVLYKGAQLALSLTHPWPASGYRKIVLLVDGAELFPSHHLLLAYTAGSNPAFSPGDFL